MERKSHEEIKKSFLVISSTHFSLLVTQHSEAVLLLARPLSPPCGWMVATQLESLNVDAAKLTIRTNKQGALLRCYWLYSPMFISDNSLQTTPGGALPASGINGANLNIQ